MTFQAELVCRSRVFGSIRNVKVGEAFLIFVHQKKKKKSHDENAQRRGLTRARWYTQRNVAFFSLEISVFRVRPQIPSRRFFRGLPVVHLKIYTSAAEWIVYIV